MKGAAGDTQDCLTTMERPIRTLMGLGVALKVLGRSEETVSSHIVEAMGDAIELVAGFVSDLRDDAEKGIDQAQRAAR